MTYVSRRSALTIIAGGTAALAAGRARAEDKAGRVIYPVAVPVYQTQFIADRIGYFKEAGLDCKLVQGGSGVKTREIIASSQGDIGIGDITHPMQLSNHGRAGRVLMPVDTRSSSVMFIIRKDLFDQGITTLEALTAWKRPDGRKPIVSVSSLGGTNHVWASYYMETMGLDQKVTWIGTGNVDTMMGTLKTKQVDVLVSSLSLLNDSKEQGWVAISGEFSRSTCRVRAPMVRMPPFTAIPRSSASSPISTISSGEISRRFIAGIRLWPPDNTLAPSPCAASSSSAFVTLVARA